MTAIREIGILLRNAALVTLAVVLGFVLGGVIGLPSWLKIVCLIPACYLFLRLVGEPIPSVRRWVPHAIALTILVAAASFVLDSFPSLYDSPWLVILPFGIASLFRRPLAAWIERHWPGNDIEASTANKDTMPTNRTEKD